MTFKEAKEKLRVLAKGQYRFLGYRLTEPRVGESEAECTVYILGGEIYSGATWEEAFCNMENATKVTVSDPEEAPE